MAFTGNEDHNITLDQAAELTSNYRQGIAAAGTLGEYFSKTFIQKILGQPDCVGIRVYYGQDAAGEKHLVICGVNASEDDLETGILAENALKCPPFKGINNALNS